MKHLDLFSGIGGFALGLQRTGGFETVGFCEIDPFCRKVLAKHWPDVPVHDDVRELNGGTVGHIDIITGGYPCQPFSLAGNRRGAEDDRHLWPEMARLVDELRPAWVIGENVFGHISMGLDEVLSDLEALDYTARAFVIPACAVDAPHRRDRIWIIAHANGNSESDGAEHGNAGCGELGIAADTNNPQRRRGAERGSSGDGQSQLHGEGGETVADTTGQGSEHNSQDAPGGEQSRRHTIGGGGLRQRGNGSDATGWLPEPNVGRVAHGIPRRLHGDRLDGDEMDGAKASAEGGTDTERVPGLRGNGKITEAPPRLQQAGLVRDTVRTVSRQSGPEGRSPAPETEAEMYDMQNDVSAEGQPQPQDVQREVSIGDWAAQCDEAMAWPPEPEGVPRVATGVKNRVDRLKSLGNAVVPAIPEMIGRAILEASA